MSTTPFCKAYVYLPDGSKKEYFGRSTDVGNFLNKHTNAVIHQTYYHDESYGRSKRTSTLFIVKHPMCHVSFRKIETRGEKEYKMIFFSKNFLAIKEVGRIPRKYLNQLNQIKALSMKSTEFDENQFDKIIIDPTNNDFHEALY